MAPPRSVAYGLVCHLVKDNATHAEISKALSTIFDATDYKYSIENLPEKDLKMWVDRLDQVYQVLKSPRVFS